MTAAPDLDSLTLAQTVDLLRAAADKVNEAAANAGVTGLEWTEALRLLDQLREATRTTGYVDAALVKHIYLTGEHGRVEVPGLGVVDISRARDRRSWDARSLARAVIDHHMGESDGTAPDPWDVAEWLLEVIAADRCRVTPLRAMGLEPQAFCQDTPGSIGVQLPRRQPRR